MVHFNWLQLAPGVNHHNLHIAMFGAVSLAIVSLGLVARASLGKGEAAITPARSFGIKALFEAVTEFVVAISDMVVGEKGRSYVPMFASIFLIVFFNNVMGLVPGTTPATDNINTTLSMGLFMFVVYNYLGFKEHGIGYLKHFLGPFLLLAPLMLVVETISHLVRPLSLGLRLFVNMMADHTLMGVAISLVPFVVPVALLFLGLFVCFMQAFVFMMLGMIYVSMAQSHDH
jgi:F-type H+-transporting ATPase subunit a